MTITITKARLALLVAAIALLVPATAVATHIFDDVPDSAFYAEPVEWAFDNEITTGRTPSLFDPGAGVTRGESVTFLNRYDTNLVQPQLADLQDRVDALEATPAAVTGVTASTGGGSGEVQVTWDPLPDVSLYRVYVQKGTGTAWHLAVVTDDALGLLETGRLGIVDAPDYWPWPTIGVPAPRCYHVTAVSELGLEGPLSAVACGSPP